MYKKDNQGESWFTRLDPFNPDESTILMKTWCLMDLVKWLYCQFGHFPSLILKLNRGIVSGGAFGGIDVDFIFI